MKTQRKRDTTKYIKKPEQQSNNEPDSDIKILDSMYFSYFKSKNIIFRALIFNAVLLTKILIVKEKRLERKHQNGLKRQKATGYRNSEKSCISRVDIL